MMYIDRAPTSTIDTRRRLDVWHSNDVGTLRIVAAFHAATLTCHHWCLSPGRYVCCWCSSASLDGLCIICVKGRHG